MSDIASGIRPRRRNPMLDIRPVEVNGIPRKNQLNGRVFLLLWKMRNGIGCGAYLKVVDALSGKVELQYADSGNVHEIAWPSSGWPIYPNRQYSLCGRKVLVYMSTISDIMELTGRFPACRFKPSATQ